MLSSVGESMKYWRPGAVNLVGSSVGKSCVAIFDEAQHLSTEFLAASYYAQSRAGREDSLKTALHLARQAATNSPRFGFAWARVAELEFSFGHTPFWATNGARLMTGPIGYGMWQERCQELCREAGKPNAIVHLGNLGELSDLATVIP